VRAIEYHVNFMWDDEAAVWVATSDDIKGLVLEGGSADALIEHVRIAVPELLKMNSQMPATKLNVHFEKSVGMTA